MRFLVTGSSGHLGEGLVRVLRDAGHHVTGLDLLPGPFTTDMGSIIDRRLVARCMSDVDVVFHTATLHKPHIATHSRQDFVDTNITGTLNLLEEAAAARVTAFIFTSTTSVFGYALRPPSDAPAVWVTEDLRPIPKNIYGVTKAAAEDLCELFHRRFALPCIVLRTSRFFPEQDDDARVRSVFSDENQKVNEFLYRRADLADIVSAHQLAAEHAPRIGFAKFIVSATSPFTRDHLADLHRDAPSVIRRLFPDAEAEYVRRGWKMPAAIDRVYINERARTELGWRPMYDFRHILDQLHAGQPIRSPLAQVVGSKGYHAETFAEGPYPVD